MSRPKAIAIAAHPDDIELKMAGTLLRLKEKGWDIHYCNLATGQGGSLEYDAEKTASVRRSEAQKAAEILGATWHPPITDDFGIFYNRKQLREVAALIREVRPSIVLTHPGEDYMEDHINAGRLTVSAVFARGIPNFETDPPRPAYFDDVTVYHCMPHGGRNRIRQRVMPGAWVDTTDVHATVREALAAHKSQRSWLDSSQGMDDYLVSMDDHAEAMGGLSGKFFKAEGWWRHLHLGFSASDSDPLAEALGDRYWVNQEYEERIERPAPPAT
ncbi:MAG: PIG-L family deacetylase [Luteolibacter sp.]